MERNKEKDVKKKEYKDEKESEKSMEAYTNERLSI